MYDVSQLRVWSGKYEVSERCLVIFQLFVLAIIINWPLDVECVTNY